MKIWTSRISTKCQSESFGKSFVNFRERSLSLESKVNTQLSLRLKQRFVIYKESLSFVLDSLTKSVTAQHPNKKLKSSSKLKYRR